MHHNIASLLSWLLPLSESKEARPALQEWRIVGWFGDASGTSECLCGQKGIKQLYTIRHKKNGQELFPIGSRCMKRFHNEDLNTSMTILAKLEKTFNCQGSKYNGRKFKDILENKSYINFLRNQEYLKKQHLKLLELADILESDEYKHLMTVKC